MTYSFSTGRETRSRKTEDGTGKKTRGEREIEKERLKVDRRKEEYLCSNKAEICDYTVGK